MTSAVTVLAWTDLPGLTLQHLSFSGHQWTPGAMTRAGSMILRVRTLLGDEQYREEEYSPYLSITNKKRTES